MIADLMSRRSRSDCEERGADGSQLIAMGRRRTVKSTLQHFRRTRTTALCLRNSRFSWRRIPIHLLMILQGVLTACR